MCLQSYENKVEMRLQATYFKYNKYFICRLSRCAHRGGRCFLAIAGAVVCSLRTCCHTMPGAAGKGSGGGTACVQTAFASTRTTRCFYSNYPLLLLELPTASSRYKLSYEPSRTLGSVCSEWGSSVIVAGASPCVVPGVWKSPAGHPPPAWGTRDGRQGSTLRHRPCDDV